MLFDEETESLWYHLEGDIAMTAISGEYAGSRVPELPFAHTDLGCVEGTAPGHRVSRSRQSARAVGGQKKGWDGSGRSVTGRLPAPPPTRWIGTTRGIRARPAARGSTTRERGTNNPEGPDRPGARLEYEGYLAAVLSAFLTAARLGACPGNARSRPGDRRLLRCGGDGAEYEMFHGAKWGQTQMRSGRVPPPRLNFSRLPGSIRSASA